MSMDFVRQFVTAHPLFALLWAGLCSAASADIFSFLRWKSWADFQTWDWRRATLTWIQGAIGNAVGTLLVAGGSTAIALAMYAVGVYLLTK